MLSAISPFTDPSRSPSLGLVPAIQAAIAYAPGLERSRITVTCESGIVLLNGTTHSREAMEQAALIARHIGGFPVRNRLALTIDDGIEDSDAHHI
jgi:hypothetical protein